MTGSGKNWKRKEVGTFGLNFVFGGENCDEILVRVATFGCIFSLILGGLYRRYAGHRGIVTCRT